MKHAVAVLLALAVLSGAPYVMLVADAAEDDVVIGELAAIEGHLDQAKIESGAVSLKECLRRGRILFEAVFNKLDGQGGPCREETASLGDPGNRRSSARRDQTPTLVSVAMPSRAPAAAAISLRVFVLAQTLDPVTESVDGALSNERNTLAMMGARPRDVGP